MPVASVHEEIVKLAIARVEAMALDGMQGRVIRLAVKAGSWQTAKPSGNFIVVTGYGQLRALLDDDTCHRRIGYPLTIAPVYRSTREWDAADEDAQMETTQKLLDAFIERPLTLTYAGATNDDIVFVGGVTLMGLVESFQEVMREVTFEVQVSQLRT